MLNFIVIRQMLRLRIHEILDFEKCPSIKLDCSYIAANSVKLYAYTRILS